MMEQPLIPDNEKEDKGKVKTETNEKNAHLAKRDFIEKSKRYKRNQKLKFFPSLLYFLFPSLRKQDLNNQRAIFLSQPSFNPVFFSNKESNTKYSVLSFVPLVIINQFKFFGNQFYLVMTLSQLIDIFKVGFLFSYLAPLLIVITMTLFKELFDEIKRYKQDSVTNNELYTKLSYEKLSQKITATMIKAKDIKVGDIILLKKNQRAPADLIIIKSREKGPIFIRTDQLDGETDLKLKKCSSIFMNQKFSDKMMFVSRTIIEFEPPSKEIYKFKGNIYLRTNEGVEKEPLSYDNTVWSSTVLATNEIYGVVIYTGKDTRTKMNASHPRMKNSKVDLEINYFNKVLFVVMVVLALVVTILKQSEALYKLILFFRFIVLFCGIIPISLRVNLDLSKEYFSYLISNDSEIPGTIVRNSAIPEDLGRIQYIFSDKTGTLTKNEMIFKTLTVKTSEGKSNVYDNSETIKSIIRDKESNVTRSVYTMALCNNVMPIFENGNMTYQASSPDELALVEYAEKCGIKILNRDDSSMILSILEKQEEFTLLEMFPFTSERKRMGIIVRDSSDKLTFYIKGAENVMSKLISSEHDVDFISSGATELAKKGLRVLVLAAKEIDNDAYETWKAAYNEALVANNLKEKQRLIDEIEKGVNFLCLTAVEDLLQDNIQDTFKNLRGAGMKIWMLTGDKAETAECISITSGLQSPDQVIFPIRDLKNMKKNDETEIQTVQRRLKEYGDSPTQKNQILLIESDVISKCLSKEVEKQFFTVALKAPAVICCRSSPTQKSEIVSRVKKYTTARTIAIGDGGNDVSMIQQADVGIGIVGKEGLQASLASDYSILKFCYLNQLLLWHGRLSYMNTGTMSNFIIHRGLIISFIQCLFSCVFYFNPVALYNGMLILGYGTLYTNLPAMSILLDRDVLNKEALENPKLYKTLSHGAPQLSNKKFLIWFGKGIYQAAAIMIGSLVVFEDNIFLKIVTVTFTELIFAELLNVYLEIRRFNLKILGVLILTCISYCLSLYFFSWLLDVYFIFDSKTISRILIVTVIAWLPVWVVDKVARLCFK